MAFRKEIAILTEQEIDNIRRFVSSKQELFVEETQKLRKGAAVKIIEGPFAGMTGTLVDNCKNGNFAVRIEAIGLSLVTHIDRLMLATIPEE